MQVRREVVELQTYRQADERGLADDDVEIQCLPPGTELLLGQYRITGYLNAGGFGITYLAIDSLGRTVVVKECFPSEMCLRVGSAMKTRSPRYSQELAGVVRHFVDEAHRLANLRHPNIVHVHQIFEENETAYIAMDFIDGPDLLDIIEEDRERLAPDEVVDLTRKILGAIGFIHGKGILHRDISPDNILIGPDGEPVLIDFGAARDRANRSRRAVTRLKFVKDGYSPQEFYLDGTGQGPWSDLYSVAASLYHLISGEAPVDAQTRIAAIAAKKPDPYRPLAGQVAGYPTRYLQALDKALAALPNDRLQGADDWLGMISGRSGVRPLYPVAGYLRRVSASVRGPRAVDARRALAGAGLAAGVSIVALGVWAFLADAPGTGGAEGEADLATAPWTGETPPTVTMRAASLDRAPATTAAPPDVAESSKPTRVVSPQVLASVVPPATGPVTVQAPDLPVAPATQTVGQTPALEVAVPEVTAPDRMAEATAKPDTFRHPEPLSRPLRPATVVSLVSAPDPGDVANVTADFSEPPSQTSRTLALPTVIADRVAEPPAPLPALQKAGRASQIAWSNWSVQLPFVEEAVKEDGENGIRIASVGARSGFTMSDRWIGEGVVILSVNGSSLRPGTSLSDHILTLLEADADGYLRATVKYRDPATGLTGRGRLTVPVLRETGLADGTVLETRKENLSWVTRVRTAGPGSDLRAGDILVGEVFTGTRFSDHGDVASAVRALDRNGVERAEFVILRGNRRQMVAWRLASG